jgi:hypothetical protein
MINPIVKLILLLSLAAAIAAVVVAFIELQEKIRP